MASDAARALFENGAGELSDAASALDWLQAYNKDAKICWIVGVSFGAWISMQLLMRRPEISGFISIAPLAKHYDFSFLAPCPSSGLFVNGDLDTVTPPEAAQNLVSKLKTQKGIVIEHKVLAGANHFFENKIDELVTICGSLSGSPAGQGTSNRVMDAARHGLRHAGCRGKAQR